MAVETRTRHPAQFTLRSLLLAITVLAVIIANWRVLLEFAFHNFWFTTAAGFAASFLVGWRSHPNSLPERSRNDRRSIVRLLVLVLLISTVATIWTRYRWSALVDDSIWPRRLLYPDKILLAFHDWLDARYPAKAGTFKFHGEIDSVFYVLNTAAWISTTFFGYSTGLLFYKVK